jgi:hypothetical protein
MFWQVDLKTPALVGSMLIVIVSELELSQLVIDKLTTELIERLRSDLADSAWAGALRSNSVVTVIARQLVAVAIQLLIDLFITGLLRFARSDCRERERERERERLLL